MRKSAAGAPDPNRPAAEDRGMDRLATLGYLGGDGSPAVSDYSPTLEDPKDLLPAYERLSHANGLFVSNRTAEARSELLDLVADRPRLTSAHALLGMIAVQGRDFVEATARCAAIVDILGAAGASSPHTAGGVGDVTIGRLDTRDLATARINLALMLKESGKVDQAIAQYEQVLKMQPDHVEVHFELGVLLSGAGRFTDAIVHYEHALRSRPEFVLAHLNLANALMQAGKRTDALPHYREVLRLDPNQPDAHWFYGLALQIMGQPSEAVVQFEQLLRLRPDYARTNPNFAPALQEARRSATAKR